jgi:hypothetical protein
LFRRVDDALEAFFASCLRGHATHLTLHAFFNNTPM